MPIWVNFWWSVNYEMWMQVVELPLHWNVCMWVKWGVVDLLHWWQLEAVILYNAVRSYISLHTKFTTAFVIFRAHRELGGNIRLYAQHNLGDVLFVDFTSILHFAYSIAFVWAVEFLILFKAELLPEIQLETWQYLQRSSFLHVAVSHVARRWTG